MRTAASVLKPVFGSDGPAGAESPVVVAAGVALVLEPVLEPDELPVELLPPLDPLVPELPFEELVSASTTIVPCMNGWIWQTYANVPGCSNVCEALWPLFRVPVLKLPSLAVAVCGLGPLFVHVTVSPAWIVSVAGANLKSEIVSPGSPAT